MGKYEDWVKKKSIPAKMSILELSVLAEKLGVDVDVIEERHYNALHYDLFEAVKAKGIVIQE